MRTVVELLNFSASAKPGERFEYHRGNLAADAIGANLGKAASAGMIAREAMNLHERGIVLLVQKNIGRDHKKDDWRVFSYLAVKLCRT